MMTKQQAADVIRGGKTARGVSWARLGEAVGAAVPWTVSALLGQQPMTADQAEAALSLLHLHLTEAWDDLLAAPQAQPTRGALDAPVPTDPTIYRFYEIVQVYGPTIKELIHEEFGDGIMSAINFRMDGPREEDPAWRG